MVTMEDSERGVGRNQAGGLPSRLHHLPDRLPLLGREHVPPSRLLIAPDSPHQVMVAQPALFNQAAGSFYRSTEKIARERAERGAARPAAPASGHDGAAALDPTAIAVTDPDDGSDPFHVW